MDLMKSMLENKGTLAAEAVKENSKHYDSGPDYLHSDLAADVVESLVESVHTDYGVAVSEQFKNILEGEAFSDQNVTALEAVSKFLEGKEEYKGIKEQVDAYVESLNEAPEDDEDEEKGPPKDKDNIPDADAETPPEKGGAPAAPGGADMPPSSPAAAGDGGEEPPAGDIDIPSPDKQYLGQKGDQNFYLVRNKDDEGNTVAIEVFDAEGNSVHKAEIGGEEDKKDDVFMLLDIIKDMDIDNVSRDIYINHIEELQKKLDEEENEEELGGDEPEIAPPPADGGEKPPVEGKLPDVTKSPEEDQYNDLLEKYDEVMAQIQEKFDKEEQKTVLESVAEKVKVIKESEEKVYDGLLESFDELLKVMSEAEVNEEQKKAIDSLSEKVKAVKRK